jgi:hypothetical protein
MKTKIIKGYKGVIDLDLTNVNPKLHKELIKQHYQDIKNYKMEQANLPEKLRYENTVGEAYRKIEIENKIIVKRLNLEKN